MELSDTKPVSHRHRPHTGSAIATAIGARARNIPAAVATPFPPLKPTNGENMCPSTAVAPNAAAHAAPNPDHAPNQATGTAPFATSTSATGTAYFQPSIRNTLVAPRFLLPCARRSIPRASFPATKLVGKAPSRYAPASQGSQLTLAPAGGGT